jgi:hypothetical protein
VFSSPGRSPAKAREKLTSSRTPLSVKSVSGASKSNTSADNCGRTKWCRLTKRLAIMVMALAAACTAVSDRLPSGSSLSDGLGGGKLLESKKKGLRGGTNREGRYEAALAYACGGNCVGAVTGSRRSHCCIWGATSRPLRRADRPQSWVEHSEGC